jgi:hypothetical protein
LAAACGDGFVFPVLALQSGNGHGFVFKGCKTNQNSIFSGMVLRINCHRP